MTKELWIRLPWWSVMMAADVDIRDHAWVRVLVPVRRLNSGSNRRIIDGVVEEICENEVAAMQK
jgi:hypothetical protein